MREFAFALPVETARTVLAMDGFDEFAGGGDGEPPASCRARWTFELDADGNSACSDERLIPLKLMLLMFDRIVAVRRKSESTDE